MPGPMMSAPVGAQQIAQQKLQDQSTQQTSKSAGSKFDSVMQGKAQGAKAPNAANNVHGSQNVQAAQAAERAQAATRSQRIDNAHKVNASQTTDRAHSRALSQPGLSQHASPRAVEEVSAKADAAKTSKSDSAVLGDTLTSIMGGIEKGQGLMDKLISGGISGKQFSSSELLALQAGMYKYTQELELTGKVVEKATTGLKDTLKTQV
jgi:hypothetical protein